MRGTILDDAHKDRWQEDLASYFDKSASAVQKYADGFERSYARPAIEMFLTVFREHPTLSTFGAIFLSLGFAPFVCFTVFSIFTVVSIFFFVLFSSFIVIAVVEACLASLLAVILTVLLLVSVPLTVFAISTYLLVRFIVLVRTEGSGGVSKWTSETRRCFIHCKTPVGKDSADTSSEASSNSAVVVKDDDYDDFHSAGVANTTALKEDGVKLEE